MELTVDMGIPCSDPPSRQDLQLQPLGVLSADNFLLSAPSGPASVAESCLAQTQILPGTAPSVTGEVRDIRPRI